MGKHTKPPLPWALAWQPQQKTLTLEGEPVAQLSLSLPQIKSGGRGGQRINRYYQALGRAWLRRWEGEFYCRACLALSRCREESRPFAPWVGTLEGRATCQEGDRLSLCLDVKEVQGDGRPLCLRLADNWTVSTGSPISGRALLPGGRKARRAQLQQLERQGTELRASGLCFLDEDFIRQLPRFLSPRNCCLAQEGWELYIPQCAMAPAIEEVVTFRLGSSAPPSGK